VLSGLEKNTRLPLSVCVYWVTPEYRGTVRRLIFDSCRETYLGQGWLWNAFKALPEAAAGCSMVIAEVHERHLKWAGKDAGIVIPTWIRGHVPLPRGPAVMKDSRIKRIHRRIRQHELSWELTRDPEKFEHFYNRMCVPYSKARFGEGAFIFSKENVRAIFDRGELLLVNKGGEHIAGQLIDYRNKKSASIPLLGLLDANAEFVSMGALAAGYEFTLQHLEKNGHRSVGFGQSQAFLKDGVLQFKKSFGHVISSSNELKYVVNFLSDTPAARAFLKNNPLIFERSDGLRGAIFIGGAEPTVEMLAEAYKNYFHPGLVELLVVSLASEDDGGLKPGEVPSEFSMPTKELQQSGMDCRWLAKDECDVLIGPLGALPIAGAVAIRPRLTSSVQ